MQIICKKKDETERIKVKRNDDQDGEKWKPKGKNSVLKMIIQDS